MRNCRWRGWAAIVAWFAACGATSVAKEETWLRVTSPEFTLITSLNQKEATAWAGEFAQYVAALRSYFVNGQRQLAPLTIVVFAREKDFEKYRPLGSNGKPQEVAGFFARHESWAVAGLGSVDVSADTRRTIFHEGVHWFLSQQDRRNPVWLEEGLAEVFSTFDVTKTQAEWGKAIEPHVGLLRTTAGLPLEQLLFTAHDEIFGDDSLRTSLVYAKSWAFVHFLIYGKHGIPREALVTYADLAQSGMNPDEAFRRAFGKSYLQIDNLLDAYLRTGQYFITKQPLAAVPPPQIQVASKLEVADALGRLALMARRWSLAAEEARAVIAAAEADPRGHELLGFALKEDGDVPGALAEFRRAKECDSRDFAPYFELACAVQNAGGDGTGGVTLSGADARMAASNYERAINLNPRFLGSYQNLAGIVALIEPLNENDPQFLALGRKLFPRDAMIRIGQAVLVRRNGDREASRTILDGVLNTKATIASNARAYAQRLDTAWEQQDIFGEVNRLAEAKLFTEAVALIDQRLEQGVSAYVRPLLVRSRQELQASATVQQLQRALEQRDWTEARRLASELASSNAPSSTRQQARRTLDQLDQMPVAARAKPTNP
jgi:tetratricopeptide (TPR) repeat protein